MVSHLTEGASVADLIDLLEIAAVGTAESALVNDGSCVPPTVHMVSSVSASPYLGYVLSRPFHQGADAATAVERMGALPAALTARRLVLSWEHADLASALELSGAPFSTAVVVVDARRDGHEVRWHPFDMELGQPAPSGLPTVIPRWAPAWREPGGALPDPVTRLLATWRAGRDPRELHWLHARMWSEGYTVRWMAKKDPETAAEAAR